MPFGGALVPLGVMGIRASGKGLLGDRAAGGHQEGPTGLWEGRRNTRLGSHFGTLNLGVSPSTHSLGGAWKQGMGRAGSWPGLHPGWDALCQHPSPGGQTSGR